MDTGIAIAPAAKACLLVMNASDAGAHAFTPDQGRGRAVTSPLWSDRVTDDDGRALELADDKNQVCFAAACGFAEVLMRPGPPSTVTGRRALQQRGLPTERRCRS